ncbi:two-component regulator propeller domain-containing protein [Desulfococcaceae bacterium HSG8]|nr:two-component regulator propeller domain-containing protein [Desulfococcaceae bacterium HSG8]
MKRFVMRGIIGSIIGWCCLFSSAMNVAQASDAAAGNVQEGQAAMKAAIRFNRLTMEDGLSSGFVQAVLQDSQGFIWFGTRGGLNRYDGYSITAYHYNPQDANSLSGDYVTSLYQDSRGAIWIGTYGSGLNHFDPRTETFTRYQHDEADPGTLRGAVVDAIYEDRQGTIWAGTRQGGLNRFDQDSRAFTHYQPIRNDPHSLGGEYVTSIYEDDAGRLWIGTLGGGLNLFHPESQSFTRYQHDPAAPASLSHNEVTSVISAGAGLLWVGTSGGGFNLFDPDAGTFTRFTTENSELSDNRTVALLLDSQSLLWIGTESKGLNRFNPKTNTFALYLPDPANPYSISGDYVMKMIEDSAGIIWFATFGDSVSKFDPLSNRFRHYYHDANNPNSLSNNRILSFQEDDAGMLWIGTDVGGLNRFDTRTGIFTRYPFIDGNLPETTDPQRLSTDTVTCIEKDNAGRLWLGTWNGGLNTFDLAAETFTYYLADEDDPNALHSNTALSLHFDGESILWIGTDRKGLTKYDLTAETFTHYLADANNPNSLSDNTITDIYEDGEGILWLATRNGLTRLDPSTETFTKYLPDENDLSKLSYPYVWRIHEDGDGALWITTRGGGLHKFDRATGQFNRYQKADGLPSNTLYCIYEDGQGCLWLSTTSGLTKFDPATETFRTYDVRDGLQANEFGWGGLKTRNGEMLFGGANGFNMFHPATLPENTTPPPLVLTEFLLFNKPVPIDPEGLLPQKIQYVTNIALSPENSVFAFEFAALSYASPEKNQFAYKLEGLEQEWNTVDSARRFAGYNSLSPDEYIFRVKAANNDGLWNDEGLSLHITVLPAWWQTWWFKIVSAIALLGLIFIVYKARVESIEARNRKLEQEVRDRTAELSKAMDALWGEMELAKRIQTVLLPKSPEISGYEIAVSMEPSEEVGGDYYDIISVGEYDWIVIGDVSGHGVTAGLVMMMVQTAIHTVLLNNPGVASSKLLAIINRTLYQNIKKMHEYKHMTIVVLAGMTNGEWTFSGLHEDILIWRVETGKVEEIETNGMWIGMEPDISDMLVTETLSLHPGDCMVLFTDGITEARGEDGSLFGIRPLVEIVERSGHLSVSELHADVITALEPYKKSDDVTLVVIKRSTIEKGEKSCPTGVFTSQGSDFQSRRDD